MRFCARWSNQLKHEADFNELIIRFKPDKLPELVKFLKSHSMQRIVIEIEDAEQFMKMNSIAIFKDIKFKYHCDNFVLRAPDFYNHSISPEFAHELAAASIPYYFNTVVSDFDTLQGFIRMGVHDVLIGNEIGFELKALAEVAEETGVWLRAYPNVAQSRWAGTPAEKCFFIRPEAALAYGEIIDVFEFYQNGDSRTNPDVLYDIYAGHGKWSGSLDELIMYFDKHVDSRDLMTEFDAVRMRCGKKCYKGASCRICDRAIDLAAAMEENNIILNMRP